ncbi:hypothetical protein [Schleiferilactobacillus shenzhenensis]|uniref:hypothetical protein n=1 Tax=Schleiferilactobacillus shenzhenensis TaxID=1231337 RepID=UPI00040B2F48|nr:hypothetical protein [Schleiferilactobacillus shenzhenensis]
MAKKKQREARHQAIVDMNDFLFSYAHKTLPDVPLDQLAGKLISAAEPDLHGLDSLFHDNGIGREDNFYAIGLGFVKDYYDIGGEQATQETDKLAQEALAYLKGHSADFVSWEH